MAPAESYEKEPLKTLTREAPPARTPNSESHPPLHSSCTLPRPPSPSKTTNKPRHPRVRRNRPRTFWNIRNTTAMLTCLIGIPFAWITYFFTLPWVIPSVHWSPVLAFFFLPWWVYTAATLWKRYRRYRMNRTITDDEAVIGLLDADETLEDGLDLHAVGYKDKDEFGMRK